MNARFNDGGAITREITAINTEREKKAQQANQRGIKQWVGERDEKACYHSNEII